MDDIRRKLALIDKQLEGGFVSTYKRIISTSPLVFAAVGLIIGILLQNAFDLSGFFWLMLLTLAATTTALCFASRISYLVKKTDPAHVAAFLALVCFVCLGAIRLIGYRHVSSNDISRVIGSEQTLATIRGSIVAQPYINRNERWEFAKFIPRDPGSSFYLKVYEVETTAGWAKATGTVRVQVAEPVLGLKAGDYVQVYCWLDRFKKTTNPGQFDTAEYLARKNVFIAASVPLRDAIEFLKNNSTGTFIKIERNLQKIAVQALSGEMDIESENYALLQALVLGYRTKIDSNTYRAFQKTGLLHFICLSGMNFAILIGIIWWLCKTAGLMKPARAVICIFAAVIFLLVVPPNPPAFRAAIICFVFCASFFFRRRPNSINTLSLAAIILLLIRPTELFEASWQLSFASVLGILLFACPIENFINEKVTALLEDPMAGKPRSYSHIVSRLASPVISVFSVSLAAWLASAGILLYQFYTINYLTSVWTVIVSPLIGVLSIVGYLKMLVALVLPTAASILDVIIKPLSGLLIWIVKLIAGLNISEILVGKVSPAVVIMYYAFFLVVFFAYFRRPFVKKLICVAAAIVIIVLLGAEKWHRTYRDNLILTCLDVGHGQAIVAQLPGKANVLFDAGSLDRSDVGGRIVAPFLNYSRIGKIDCIVISHNDVDHINGIPEIADYCRIGKIYANDMFFDAAATSEAAQFLKQSLHKKRRGVYRLGRELPLSSKARVKILWPTEQILQNEELHDNDKSAVLLIEFAGKKVLLCSDIEKFAQAELFRIYPDLKADVVVVPHHGSRKTAEQHFLENLDAEILIYSCSRSRYERQQVIDSGSEAKTFYTPRDGAVTICISRDGCIDAHPIPWAP